MNGPVGIANGLVLYDWDGELDQARWFDIALQSRRAQNIANDMWS